MLRLRDIMTTELVTLDPELSLRDAMSTLATKHLSGAPVVSGSTVVGVISLSDLADFAATLPGVPSMREASPEPLDFEIDEDLGEGDEPAGLFYSEMWDDTGADLVERFAESTGPEWNALEEHTVEEAMTRALKALPPDTLVDRAAEFMRREGVHRVLVMDGDALLGIVSAKDIADAVGEHKLVACTYVFNKGAERDERGWE